MKYLIILNLIFIVVQFLSHVQLFASPQTAARQVSLSFTISWSLLKLMFIELMMPSNPLILCHPFFLLPSIFPSIMVFSNESILLIRGPKYWHFNFKSVLPMNLWFYGKSSIFFFSIQFIVAKLLLDILSSRL